MKVTDNETRWTKIGEIRHIAFVGKEVLFFGTGCHLLFINLNSGEELMYTANGHRTGDGVQCYAGHRTQNVFAFAEKRSGATIFLKTYPNFEEIHNLKDDASKSYVNIVFSESSLLITVGDLPDFNLTVWNWRQAEKIACQKGSILKRDQMLKCNFSSPVFMAQLGINTHLLHVWDIFICGKKCILTEHTTKMQEKCSVFTGVLWTSEGGLFVLDSSGCVYTVLPDHQLEKVIDFTEPGDYPTSFAWYKFGIAVAGPNNEIRHYKKSGTWTMDWSLVPPEPTSIMMARFEYLITVTTKFNIIQVLATQNEFKCIKEHESGFDDICLIYPTGQHVLTLAHHHELNLYRVATGELTSTLDLEGSARLLVENPKFPYAALGFESGVIKLISAYNPEKLVKMTQFFLTRHAADSIVFNECGTVFVVANLTIGRFFIVEGLPGGQMDIIATVDTNCQIADFTMAISLACYRMFMIPVTSTECIAGNVVLRFCVIKDKKIDIKEYSFEDTKSLFCRIVPSWGHTRDRLFYIVPYDGKAVNEVETKRGDPTAKILRKIPTGHQMHDIHLRLDRKAALTWGFDGFVIARGSDFTRQIGIALPHHRTQGGVKRAYMDPCEKYVVSLGRDGVLVCTNLMESLPQPDLKEELEELHASEDYKLLFSRRTFGFVPRGIYEGKCYLEVNEMRRIEKERVQCEKERFEILEEVRSIRKELQELLTTNLEGPESERLDLKEFNLNVRLYERKAAEHKKLRKATEVYLKELIEAQNRVSDYMMTQYWEKMKIPGTAINGIFANFEVTNYVMRAPDENREEILQWIRVVRRLESYLNEMVPFRPWDPIDEDKLVKLMSSRPRLPKRDEHLTVLSALDMDALEPEEDEEDEETKIAFSGSDIARFIEVQEVHYLQNELQTYFQTELQWVLAKSDSYRLKEYFNARFNQMMLQKIKEMSNIKKKNARLRHIVSELNHFSEEQVQMRIEDPEWKQIENPEHIVHVKDEEVPITPYVSPSQQEILDAEAAEAERLRLLLLADDFRERALMAMMNGVLEVRWEDELRKDVPLPKCMLEKEPEQFNEDDLRAVKEYEEKVQFLNSERERYKMLLRAEYGTLAKGVRENIRKFNGKLSDLLNLKLQVDSAISQESLKVNRMKLFQHNRTLMMQKEQELLEKIANNDELIASLHKLMTTLHDAVIDCRNYVESFAVKDKFLERAYKKDFHEMSIVVQEQASKLFRKRPKVNLRGLNSSTMLNELSRYILSNTKPPLALNHDCLEFLKQMDNLDMYVGVPSVVDEHTFALICRHRRLRIEYEVKMKAAQNGLAEAEATSAAFHKRSQKKKELGVKLHADLHGVRQELVDASCDCDMQIVLQRGLVEIPLSGSLEDFPDGLLICRKDVECINGIILKFGDNKIKALHTAMNFRRKILALEWEHRRMRMLIQDLQEKIIDIDNVRLTKDIQFYLKCKDKEKTIPFETEVDMIKGSYENTIQDRKDKVNRMKKQINGIKHNAKIIEQKIKELNVDVCEFNMQRDRELDEKENEFIDLRVKSLLKRSKLVQQIQDNHHEILMLQTELELLRLKTFPTLKYKVV